jgi:C1A family cysteine protease
MARRSLATSNGTIELLDADDEVRLRPGGPKGLPGGAAPVVERRKALRTLFAKLNPDELAQIRALIPLPKPLTETLPSAFSWRAKGMVTAVRNQSPYGTCWAFATVGALESGWLLRHHEAVDVSEQDLINCNCRPCNGPDTPGWTNAGDKLINTGLDAEAALPYHGDGNVFTSVNGQKQCDVAKVAANCGPPNFDKIRAYRAEEYGIIDTTEKDLEPVDVATLKQALLDHGPIVVKMHIPTGSSIGSLKGTATFKESVPLVYDDPSTPANERNNGAHIVVLTGWDDSRQAWEIKNSWGAGWGDQGFGWIAYGSNKIGMSAWWLRVWAPAFRVTAVWRHGGDDERQVYGWSYDNYRAEYDRIWQQGYRLHALDTAVVEGEVEYSAVWRKGATSETQVYGYTFEDFKKKYDELWPQGWRIHLLSNYAVNGQVRYTAVWRKGSDAEMQWFRASFDDFKKKYDELWPQGWRLHLLSNYAVNGQVRYNAVWRKGTDAEMQWFGARYADYRQKYDELWPQGWRLHLLSNYVIDGKVFYNAVWRQGTSPEVQVYSWEYDDFRTKDSELRSQGWRLALVNTYEIA